MVATVIQQNTKYKKKNRWNNIGLKDQEVIFKFTLYTEF